MRRLVLIFSLILLIYSCKKDDCPNECINNIENDIVLDIHYNKLSSCNPSDPDGSFEIYFKNEDAYFNNTECNRQPIPFELNFNGIIIAQGVKVPYISEDENIKPAYNLSVGLVKDTCLKTIDFHFVLANVDTFDVLEHNENVIVLLNGVDSTYTVNFSHKVIPYKE